MANFVLVPVLGNTSAVTNSLVAQYGVDSLGRPSSPTAGYLLVAYTSNVTFEPIYAFWHNDSSYSYPLPCFISFTDNTYKLAIIENGSTSAPTTHNIRNNLQIDGVNYWFANDFANNYGWWLQSLSSATPYNSIVDGVRDILTSTMYVTISYISGVVSVAAPRLALEGSTVTAYLTMPSGITVTESDISVKKSDTAISFTYSNGVLTFTA